MKRKQFEKYHAASAEEQATIERNPYTIFHQALKNCEPVIGLVPILKGGHFYQVSGQGEKAGLLICEMVGVEWAYLGWAKIDSFLGTAECQGLLISVPWNKDYRQKMEESQKSI